MSTEDAVTEPDPFAGSPWASGSSEPSSWSGILDAPDPTEQRAAHLMAEPEPVPRYPEVLDQRQTALRLAILHTPIPEHATVPDRLDVVEYAHFLMGDTFDSDTGGWSG